MYIVYKYQKKESNCLANISYEPLSSGSLLISRVSLFLLRGHMRYYKTYLDVVVHAQEK
jgi:hypothetical protein